MGAGILQPGTGVRFEWGPARADRLARDPACPVVVDVLPSPTGAAISATAPPDVPLVSAMGGGAADGDGSRHLRRHPLRASAHRRS